MKAYELSFEIEKKSQNIGNFSEEQKNKLATERYTLFLELIRSLVKEHLEVSVYEDSLRCIFGKDAGIFFTIDKILYNVSSHLSICDLKNYMFTNFLDREINSH